MKILIFKLFIVKYIFTSSYKVVICRKFDFQDYSNTFIVLLIMKSLQLENTETNENSFVYTNLVNPMSPFCQNNR